MPEEPAPGLVVIDSGPVLLMATTDPYCDEDQEVSDGGDRPGSGEQAD